MPRGYHREMGELSFLVEHGAEVGQALVVMGGALGVGGGWLVRRLLERRRLARERAMLGREVGALSPGRATISGVLRGRGATAVAASGKVVRARGDALALEVGDVLVELRGEVEVKSGTRTASSWRKLPRDFVEGSAEPGAWRAYELREGDEVIARGMLTNEAGMPKERDAYREPAGVWVLSAVNEAPVVQLWASRPKVQLESSHPRRLALLWFGWMAVTFSVLWVAGDELLRSHRLELAAVMPHSRDAALEQLAHYYETEAPRTDRTLQIRIALAEQQQRCGERASIELSEQRFEEALATARRCDKLDVEIEALADLGLYSQAAQLLGAANGEDASLDAAISIATGHWDIAAVAADAEVGLLSAGSDTDSYKVEGYRCLAAWFRAKAGVARDSSDLAILGPSNAMCMIARAMALPPEQRGAALAAVSIVPDERQRSATLLAADLAWAYGATTPEDGSLDLGAAIGELIGVGGDRRAWLSPLALKTRGNDAKDRAQVLGESAALDVIRGDLPTARSRLDSDGLHEAIALHSSEVIVRNPDLVSPSTATTPFVELRAGHMPETWSRPQYDDDHDLVAGISASLAGDAAPVARAIERRPRLWALDAAAVLAIVPVLREHREQLADALRNVHGDAATRDWIPFGLIEEAMMHRDLALLVGDTPSRERWQKLIAAQQPLLDDPEKLIALMLWQAEP